LRRIRRFPRLCTTLWQGGAEIGDVRSADWLRTRHHLRVRGRHFPGLSAVIRFREPTLDYELVMDNSASELYPLVAQLVREFSTEPLEPKKLSQITGVSRITAHRYIDRLYRAGVLVRQNRGEYIFVPATVRQVTP